MIIFVYDTECCQHESDDPVSAVLYFHPSWVSDTQKLSLCGQLMGTSYFLRENFASPKLISLQSGKFAIKNFDRFVLVSFYSVQIQPKTFILTYCFHFRPSERIATFLNRFLSIVLICLQIYSNSTTRTFPQFPINLLQTDSTRTYQKSFITFSKHFCPSFSIMGTYFKMFQY
jgi:hypothetical protein